MKIAIPVESKSTETSISQVFGRSPYFLIYNTETDERVFIDNPSKTAQGGAGIKAAQIIADQHVNALLCQRCGDNATEVLINAKISVYKPIYESAQDNLTAFMEGKLSPENVEK